MRRLLKWSFELREHNINYRSRTSVKGQIQADFIVECPKDDPQDTTMEDEEALSDPWILFTNGSSFIDSFEDGLIITNPEGMEFTYALRFRSDATNNEAEYEALIAGLRIAEHMGVKNLQANVDSRLVANQEVLVVVEEEGRTWMTHIHEYLVEEILPEEKKKATAVLYLLEEKREQAAIQEAKSKAKMEKYYNASVHGTSFRLGDLVYRNNKASHAEDGEVKRGGTTSEDAKVVERVVTGSAVTRAVVKEKQVKDKIETKPDQIKKKQEAWKSPAMSKSSHSQESRKKEENTNLRDQNWKS
nr:reverse transcriptase domain-containing protein [Tanacetum cinerariifolium]